MVKIKEAWSVETMPLSIPRENYFFAKKSFASDSSTSCSVNT